MVKEVEFSNESEVLAAGELYSNAPDQPILDGYLEDDGTTLKIIVHSQLNHESVSKRQLFLFFGDIDFDNTSINYVNVGTSDLDYKVVGEDATDVEYTFDLSSVLVIPRKIYSTGGSSEITIELYTYEANLSADYGAKTLSVPYTVNNDTKYKYEKSTDGVYRLMTIDFEPWNPGVIYGIGDIVERNGSLIKSDVNENEDIPEYYNWSAPTDEDITYFARGYTKNPPIRAFITDVMISRYAKYYVIAPVLLSTSFKNFDNDRSYELALLLQNLRELAKYRLLKHKPVDAAYTLQLLKTAAASTTDTTKVNSYNVKYTY